MRDGAKTVASFSSGVKGKMEVDEGRRCRDGIGCNEFRFTRPNRANRPASIRQVSAHLSVSSGGSAK